MWKLKTGSATVNNEDDQQWMSSLNNHLGRQTWCYDPEGGTPQEREAVEAARLAFTENRHQQSQSADLLLRLQFQKEYPLCNPPVQIKVKEDEEVTENAVTTTLCRAMRFYSQLQTYDGNWTGDHSGPFFFMPFLIIILYVTETLHDVLSEHHRHEICRYIYNHQRRDGGWGLHTEGSSTMFGTILSYVTLRLLDDNEKNSKNSTVLQNARSWILTHGGATHLPSWGKFWLSVLGVYDWSGVSPLPPESWLLPRSFLAHPGRLPVLYRLIFLPMSFIYGVRFSHKPTKKTLELRKELYPISYKDICWTKARTLGSKEEIAPTSLLQEAILSILYNYVEPAMIRWPGILLRRRALSCIMQHIHHEDETTHYICVCPINKALNMLCCWLEDNNSPAFKRHLPRILDYLWLSEDGMKMQVCNGSQAWDTTLSVQSLIATNFLSESSIMLAKAKSYIEKTQIQESSTKDLEHWHRYRSNGSWPQSTLDNGWPVSDCSAEALKALLLLSRLPSTIIGVATSKRKLHDCVDFLLSFQKLNGSFSPFDGRSPYEGYKNLNHSISLGHKTLDFECIECTSSAIQALMEFQKTYPDYRSKEITSSIDEGCHFIKKLQNSDGSWYGTWGICFIYATWFGIMALVAAGDTYDNSSALKKACHFLLSKQLSNGGWSESFQSSTTKRYTNLEGAKAHVVHTSWALLALLATKQENRDPTPIYKAARYLINSQMETGDYPQQGIVGAVCGDHTISYASFRCIFPIWALGEYRNHIFHSKYFE